MLYLNKVSSTIKKYINIKNTKKTMAKKIIGVALVIFSFVLMISTVKITGMVVSSNPVRVETVSIVAMMSFLLGIFLFARGDLETRVETRDKPKPSFWKRMKSSIAARTTGAIIVGSAGAYGGHQAGEYLQPKARYIERGAQIAAVVGDNIIPGTAAYAQRAKEAYLSKSGEMGAEYLANSSEQNFLSGLETSMRTLQESAGRAANYRINRSRGLKKVQESKNRIYSKVGEMIGSKDIDKRSTEQYAQNYDELAVQRINALIRLAQIDGQIENYASEALGKGVKPGSNRLVNSKMETLSAEANKIFEFLEDNKKISADDIYQMSSRYKGIIESGREIPDAGYPISDNLPYYLSIFGGALGGMYGARKKRLGGLAIKGAKSSGRAISRGSKYVGKKISNAGKSKKR